MPSQLQHFNILPATEAEAVLLTLCGSSRWAATLASQRPFADAAHLQHTANNLWFLLDEQDWLEAFQSHPRIGETKIDRIDPVTSLATSSFLNHSTSEQSAAQATMAECAKALLAGNRLYEERFGFLYIVFASGRTAPELLALLESRLTRDRGTELHEAARQQSHITTLRLRKWLQV